MDIKKLQEILKTKSSKLQELLKVHIDKVVDKTKAKMPQTDISEGMEMGRTP